MQLSIPDFSVSSSGPSAYFERMQITWIADSLERIAPNILYQILRLRQDIFIVEQHCIYPDMDNLDPECVHVWGGTTVNPVMGVARILPPGLKSEASMIGRIALHSDARGLGVGVDLIEYCIAYCDQNYQSAIELAAQQALAAYYERFGFQAVSEVYDEDGIPHVNMRREWPHA